MSFPASQSNAYQTIKQGSSQGNNFLPPIHRSCQLNALNPSNRAWWGVGENIVLKFGNVGGEVINRSFNGKKVSFNVTTAASTPGTLTITGTSIDVSTGVPIDSDTEIVSIPSDITSRYASTKTWLRTESIAISGLADIVYNVETLYSESENGKSFSISGWDLEALDSIGGLMEFTFRIYKIENLSGNEYNRIELDNITVNGSTKNIVDNFRSGVRSESYPNDITTLKAKFHYTMKDFNTFFNNGENLVDGSIGNGFLVLISATNTDSSINPPDPAKFVDYINLIINVE